MSLATFDHPLAQYIRPSAKSTANCPGCGNGILAQAILQAIDELGLSLDDFVFVSGIGCSAWIPSPSFFADVLHTTHGRPIAFATGIKAAMPEKHVMVVSGDGDLTAIGGNHLIHAARRNIAMTVVCVNNGIYGMTGGQVAPTTPLGLQTITTPFGNAENPFDICKLVEGAGASFVARWTTYHPRQIVKTMKRAIQKNGFAFVEVDLPVPGGVRPQDRHGQLGADDGALQAELGEHRQSQDDDARRTHRQDRGGRIPRHRQARTDRHYGEGARQGHGQREVDRQDAEGNRNHRLRRFHRFLGIGAGHVEFVPFVCVICEICG